jgi:hypothetical protein
MDLIANSIVFTPQRARQLVARYLESAGGCGCGPNGCGPASAPPLPRSGGKGRKEGDSQLDEFLVKAWAEKITGTDVFRVTLTAFLDVHNFDTRRVMKCCLAHVLPEGHIVPFCAYNTLYRDGFLPLPPLAETQRPATRSLTLVS